jgi:hypothetical protein
LLPVALVTALAAGGVFAGGRFISPALLDKIHPGVTTEQQVRDVLGQSVHVIDYPARRQHDWQYEAIDYGDLLEIWITFDDAGIVRGVLRMKPTGP